MALVAGPLVVVTQLVTVDGVKIMTRLTDPATSHARLRVGGAFRWRTSKKAAARPVVTPAETNMALSAQYIAVCRLKCF